MLEAHPDPNGALAAKLPISADDGRKDSESPKSFADGVSSQPQLCA